MCSPLPHDRLQKRAQSIGMPAQSVLSRMYCKRFDDMHQWRPNLLSARPHEKPSWQYESQKTVPVIGACPKPSAKKKHQSGQQHGPAAMSLFCTKPAELSTSAQDILSHLPSVGFAECWTHAAEFSPHAESGALPGLMQRHVQFHLAKISLISQAWLPVVL